MRPRASSGRCTSRTPRPTASPGRGSAGRSRMTSSRSIRPRRNGSIRPNPPCGSSSTRSSSGPSMRRTGTRSRSAGAARPAQQPEVNLIRPAVQALAAVLGGTQSLHTNSYDEAYQVPNEKAVRIALRTQTIPRHGCGVGNTVDPVGGSYFLEALTDELEEEAVRTFDRIQDLGGVIP